MGRWAWSSDALDFDSDGWEDLYVANGMLTRESGPDDLDGFFWRQVVARSPLTRVTGTPYDDAWRAINQLLIQRLDRQPPAQRAAAQRRPGRLRRRLGHGRARPRPGRPLLRRARPRPRRRSRPRRDGGAPGAAAPPVPERLRRGAARRSPCGWSARGEQPRRDRRARDASRPTGCGGRRSCRPAPASSRSIRRSCSSAWARAGACRQLTVEWPAGARRTSPTCRSNSRLRARGGRRAARESRSRRRPARQPARVPGTADTGRSRRGASLALRAVPGAGFSLPDLGGETRSLAALRGRPALLLFWLDDAAASRAALEALARGRAALGRAGVGALAVALDAAGGRSGGSRARGRRRPASGDRSRARSSALQLRDPQPPPVHEPAGPAAADGLPARRGGQRGEGLPRARRRRRVLRDAAAIEASPAERSGARRAVRRARSTSARPRATTCPTAASCWTRASRRRRVVAFERAAQASPNASTLYRLGTLLAKSGEPGAGARRLRARARAAARPLRGQQRPRRAAGAGWRPRRRRSSGSGPRSPRRPTTPTR